jgi:hypothetical protein
MAQKENRYCQQAYMKNKDSYGQARLLSHDAAPKWDEPLEDGAEGLPPTPMTENHLVLLGRKGNHRNSLDRHSDDKDPKGYPGKRTGDEFEHDALQRY